jgi:hypothetical protein
MEAKIMNLYKHPILRQGYNVMQAIEECGASEKLTKAVIMAGKLMDEVEKLVDAGRVLTCVYCGMEYPQGTPSHGAQVLTDHIKVCEKHPMRECELDRDKLRRALIGLVGVDKKEKLEEMEATLRILPMPEVDRICTINAITALLETAEKADLHAS